MTVEFKYAIGDTVEIIAIGLKGRVEAVIRDREGDQYRVIYWSNCTRNSVWMADWELK